MLAQVLMNLRGHIETVCRLRSLTVESVSHISLEVVLCASKLRTAGVSEFLVSCGHSRDEQSLQFLKHSARRPSSHLILGITDGFEVSSLKKVSL